MQVERLSKTRSFVKDQVLLDPFHPTEPQPFSNKSSSLVLTCYNHISHGKLEIHGRFTVLEGLLEFLDG